MLLEISIRKAGEVTILDLKGRATIGANTDLLNRRLRELVEEGVRHVLLNLSNVPMMDSSGIATIAGTLVSLSREGGSLKLLQPTDRVREVLTVMRLLKSIPTFDNEEEALASFQPGAQFAGS